MFEYNDIWQLAIKSIVAVLVLFLLTRLMGKKQISQLTFFDYIVGITIGSIAGQFAISNTIPYLNGIVSLTIWAMVPILISYVSLKSLGARKILDGASTILVQNGKIIEDNIRKTKLNMNDIFEELRVKGAFNVADVEFAILETNGKVSVQLKSQKQPVTPSDLSIPTQYKGLSANLILDGEIRYENLKLVELDETWLMNELKKAKVTSPSEVLLASLDTMGQLHIDKKNSDPVPLNVFE